jgi:thymidine kinase
MSLTLVVGPMCAGKTNYLLNEYSKHPEESIIITSNIDTRTKETGIWTHDKKTFNGKHIFVDDIQNHYKDIEKYQYILINEGQFMKNITQNEHYFVDE